MLFVFGAKLGNLAELNGEMWLLVRAPAIVITDYLNPTFEKLIQLHDGFLGLRSVSLQSSEITPTYYKISM